MQGWKMKIVSFIYRYKGNNWFTQTLKEMLDNFEKEIRADTIEELQQKIVGHLSDYALQEAPMYQDDLANQKPIYDAINSCIEGVIEVAEQLKEQSE